jgi:threonine/homoserine/homoserine lactone efflux protein
VLRGEDVRQAKAAAERARAGAASGGRRSRAAVVAHPTTRGVLAVLLNPGGWLFLATTASALVADARAADGRLAAFVTVIALMVGVSIMDAITVVVGGGSSLLTGKVGRWIRLGLTLLLGAIGVLFVVRGIRG